MQRCIIVWLRLRVIQRILTVMVAGVVSLLTTPVTLSGQTEATKNPITTLRVFETLIQIPVVVLGPTFELMRPFPSKRFYVSLDSGPPFQATHVRFEGDDPIALSILIDLSADDGAAADVGRAFARMAPISLQSQDRVSIYAMRHCEMWQAVKDGAPELASLGRRMGSIEQGWPGGWKKRLAANCQHKVLLLSVMSQVIHESSTRSGRRVLLVVSDGIEIGSKQGWAEVANLAADSGVAVFGLKFSEFHVDGFVDVQHSSENPFRTLCESSGGLVFSSTSTSLRQRLNGFMELLRNRYIVEFPRPDDIERGRHSMQVTISKSNAFIRSAGTSTPIADPGVLADPNTLRADPEHAPTVGKRKPLATPH